MGRAATTVMAALMLTGVTMLPARFSAIPMEPTAAALVSDPRPLYPVLDGASFMCENIIIGELEDA